VPPKCGSTACRRHFELTCISQDEFEALDYPITVVIRHPWDRIRSALCSVLRDEHQFDMRVFRHIFWRDKDFNAHVRPMFHWLVGRSVDKIIPIEDLDIPVLNQGQFLSEADHFDWSELLPIYQRDFDIWPLWKP